jgi:hypothetical protein
MEVSRIALARLTLLRRSLLDLSQAKDAQARRLPVHVFHGHSENAAAPAWSVRFAFLAINSLSHQQMERFKPFSDVPLDTVTYE